jgi:hypothetical protein
MLDNFQFRKEQEKIMMQNKKNKELTNRKIFKGIGKIELTMLAFVAIVNAVIFIWLIIKVKNEISVMLLFVMTMFYAIQQIIYLGLLSIVAQKILPELHEEKNVK